MESLRPFVHAGQRWWVEPEYEAFAREVLAPVADRVAELPGAEVVKTNKARDVVRAPGPQGELFVKRFRVDAALRRLASLWRGSPARREFLALRHLAREGIAVPRAVLLSEVPAWRGVGAMNLATEAVPESVELARRIDALREAEDADARRGLLARLAEVLQRVFAAGVWHPDLHLANFLVRPDGGLVTLDLHSVRLRGGPLGVGAQVGLLGKLAHSFGLLDPRTAAWGREELEWFVAAYAERVPAVGRPDALFARLWGAAIDLERRRLASRDRRCLVNSTEYAVQGVRGRRMWRRREVSAQTVWLALDEPAQAVVHAHPKRRSRIETLRAPAELAEQGAELVRKLYLFPHWRARLAGFFGEPQPLRAWKAARACEVRHVPVPRHYALVLEGIVPRLGSVLMEKLADVTMPHVWLQGDGVTPGRRQRLARRFGTLLGRFHAQGLKHHDLAVQNLLIRLSPDDAWELWLVDLDEVRRGAMSRKEKLRALTQVADLPPQATKSDRLRFFRAYLRAGGDRVLAAELAAWGERGLGQRVAAGLAEKARRKQARRARRERKGERDVLPTDLSALEDR
ncbi:MAG: lipopolysaccharide kinase InaA family protein [Planctomycetota bacterium]